MVRTVFVVAVACVWAVLTSQRAHVWQNEATLWTDAIYAAPQHPRPRINMGKVLAERGFYREAARQYELAMEAVPDQRRNTSMRAEVAAGVGSNLALIWMRVGKPDRALSLLNKVLDLMPWYPQARLNRGTIYWARGETALACADFAEARRRMASVPAYVGCP